MDRPKTPVPPSEPIALQRADKLVAGAREDLMQASRILDCYSGDGITPLHQAVMKSMAELDEYFEVS